MNLNLYKKILSTSSTYDMASFFFWLEQTPEFMHRDKIEIEINFLLWATANEGVLAGMVGSYKYMEME